MFIVFRIDFVSPPLGHPICQIFYKRSVVTIYSRTRCGLSRRVPIVSHAYWDTELMDIISLTVVSAAVPRFSQKVRHTLWHRLIDGTSVGPYRPIVATLYHQSLVVSMPFFARSSASLWCPVTSFVTICFTHL